MQSVKDNLTSLYFQITAAQGSLGGMSTAVSEIAQQIGDVQTRANQIEADIGRAVVNTRDTIIALLRPHVEPNVLSRVATLQAQADSKGTYLRDAKDNFIIS